jgi:hypothetical protein
MKNHNMNHSNFGSMNHSNFDREYRKTKRIVTNGMVVIVIVKLIVIGLLIFGGVKLIQYFGDNDTSVVKESGKFFEAVKGEFNEGRIEVASDTLVIDSLNTK